MKCEEDMGDEWRLIIKLNEIGFSKEERDDQGPQFIRSITRQFQERGGLSRHQWIAIERFVNYYMPEYEFDLNVPNGI